MMPAGWRNAAGSILPLALLAWGACRPQEKGAGMRDPPGLEEPFSPFEAGISELQDAMQAGSLTSRQLVEFYQARIEAYGQQGPSLNAVSVLNPQARQVADELDAERAARGPRGPLHGIPVVIKDNYDTAGMQTAGGTLALAGWVPPQDAFLVTRLREAGAVILAKTNMHEFAMGITNLGSLFGQTRNPYEPGRNPGGSSGGTGAAVAANLAVVGMGTDTCGSIRIPASHNSLVGLRGTQGLASRRGIIPLSHTQDIGGPLGRSVADVAAVMDAIAGYDPEDPETAESVGNIPGSYLDFLVLDALEGARIGLLRQLFAREPEDGEVARVVERALVEMRDLGAEVEEVAIPGLDDLMLDRDGGFLLLTYEFREDLRAYLAARPGAPVGSLEEVLASGKFHPAMESRLRERQASPAPDTPEYLEHLIKRAALREAILQAMARQGLDALAYPTIRRVAAPIGEDQGGSNCHLSANSGLPAITVPAGFSPGGMPVGLELLGRAWEEGFLMGLAHAYEQATGHRRPPASTPPLP